jgi:enamine deaminase RidA (YjgF/YER057c/UK114 family)
VSDRQKYSSGSKWEPIVGYSRAIRQGNLIWVTGTTATNDKGEIVGVGDPKAQTMQAIRNIEKALKALGATLNDVVRTRLFVTDISLWQEYGAAHGEVFRDIRPCTSMIEIQRLIDDQMLVEIEADAIVDA